MALYIYTPFKQDVEPEHVESSDGPKVVLVLKFIFIASELWIKRLNWFFTLSTVLK